MENNDRNRKKNYNELVFCIDLPFIVMFIYLIEESPILSRPKHKEFH